ncbi:plasmid stabilization system protein ParE [Mucilaginibacter yixingensis]|uniref:Plasmid stabilization system protein ParE n=1 Tax=Mucilaginibacter yixingensis TaxID=1295612 RepID=A0A2T5J825_9SPHI|nr:type II toxin-antitoxin system RelE/ParE family toxin [Mucilaginibacter yixingensis]PTQ95623.1 plasmid stabilization system protein ParE [Mucilaginibacter yixingensis]
MAKRRSLKIIILPTAQQDLREIVSFIAKDSPAYAKREKLLIIEIIDKLGYFPELGTIFNYKNVNARKFPFRSYLIIYRLIDDSLMEILSIHHHARSFSNNPALDTDDE